MEDWISLHKEDTSEDLIIFRLDEDQTDGNFEEG
jgi:hypothetical protein